MHPEPVEASIIKADSAEAEPEAVQVERLHAATEFIRTRWPVRPRVGIILGTGLGNLASHIQSDAKIPYAEIPGFPHSTAVGHRGQLVCGQLADVDIVAMDGRFHFYEGYSADQITLPVRVMRELGADILIVSNASGGLNPQFRCGEVMVMTGHVNLMGGRTAQLTGGHPFATRSVHSSVSNSPYDHEFIEGALATARRHDFVCHRGVYVSVLGPNYETRAEYRMMRRLGGDVVGMSTVPEVLVAAQCGMRVLALSMIANVARPDAPAQVNAQEVIDVVSTAEPHLRQIVLDILAIVKKANLNP